VPVADQLDRFIRRMGVDRARIAPFVEALGLDVAGTAPGAGA
jgi:hypothetical protein